MKILIAASNMVHINNFHRPYIDRLVESGHDVKIMASGEGADFDIGFKKRTFSIKNFILSSKIRKIIRSHKHLVIADDSFFCTPKKYKSRHRYANRDYNISR